MGRVLAFAYGIMAYLVFFVTSLYFIGFLENLLVPKSIDSGEPASLGRAIATNVLLLGLLAVHGAEYERYRQEVSMLLPVPKGLPGMKKALKVLIAFLFITPLFVANAYGGSDFKTIDTARLHSMVVDNAYALEGGRNRPFTVIDARTKEEYDKAHIFSAISVPEKEFEKSVNHLPKDKGVLLVVYCDGMKSDISRKWADKAKAAGYANIVIYSEGFPAWRKKAMPVAPLGKGV